MTYPISTDPEKEKRSIPITTKFAAFFALALSNSANTSKFLLFALGVSSIFMASTPLAI
jgi:hypothetical protein